MTSWFQTRLDLAKLVSDMIRCAPRPCHIAPKIFKTTFVLLEFCRTLITNHYVKVWLARVFLVTIISIEFYVTPKNHDMVAPAADFLDTNHCATIAFESQKVL